MGVQFSLEEVLEKPLDFREKPVDRARSIEDFPDYP